MASDHYDVIIIGVGSMGSSACYFLAQRGLRVLGLEQYGIAHEHGSHGGQSRIIRKAYFEHPDYVPLLERAYANWHAFEKETHEQIYHRTGIVYFGRAESENMKGVLQSASLYNIPIEQYHGETVKERFPAFKIPTDFQAILEPDAGFLTPEKAIKLYAAESRKRGASIKTYEKVIEWKKENHLMKVITDSQVYKCDKLVITAGAWTSKLVGDLPADLQVTRQLLAWVRPKFTDSFSIGNFPCWFVEDPHLGTFYGFPMLPEGSFGGPVGLKLAHHYPGEPTDADKSPGNIPANAEENIRYALRRYLPDAGDEMVTIKTCLYTNSMDQNFIIDHLPGYDGQVTIACGFSGHGFKFVSVVGEILADLAMKGYTNLPIEFLGLGRF